MARYLNLFFLLYLVGAASTPALLNLELNSDKNDISFCADVALEEAIFFDELLNNLPQFDKDNHKFSFGHSFKNFGSFPNGVLSFGHQLLQSDRVVLSTLYLLFHSFLFYG